MCLQTNVVRRGAVYYVRVGLPSEFIKERVADSAISAWATTSPAAEVQLVVGALLDCAITCGIVILNSIFAFTHVQIERTAAYLFGEDVPVPNHIKS